MLGATPSCQGIIPCEISIPTGTPSPLWYTSLLPWSVQIRHTVDRGPSADPTAKRTTSSLGLATEHPTPPGLLYALLSLSRSGVGLAPTLLLLGGLGGFSLVWRAYAGSCKHAIRRRRNVKRSLPQYHPRRRAASSSRPLEVLSPRPASSASSLGASSCR
jgi:hypothetical protein